MLSDYACNFDPKSGADLRLWPPRWQHSLRRCQRLWHGFWWLWVVPHYDGRWYLFATCHKITKVKSSWNLSFHLIIFTPFSSLFTSEKKTTPDVDVSPSLSRSVTAEHPVRVVGEVDRDGRGGWFSFVSFQFKRCRFPSYFIPVFIVCYFCFVLCVFSFFR